MRGSPSEGSESFSLEPTTNEPLARPTNVSTLGGLPWVRLVLMRPAVRSGVDQLRTAPGLLAARASVSTGRFFAQMESPRNSTDGNQVHGSSSRRNQEGDGIKSILYNVYAYNFFFQGLPHPRKASSDVQFIWPVVIDLTSTLFFPCHLQGSLCSSILILAIEPFAEPGTAHRRSARPAGAAPGPAGCCGGELYPVGF